MLGSGGRVARGGNSAIGMAVVSVAFGAAVWVLGSSVLGELDQRPIVPLHQAEVDDRAWAEGQLDGPEVIHYGPKKSRSNPRKLLDVGPRTLGLRP